MIQSAAKRLKKGGILGKAGLPAEVFKNGHVQLLHVISVLFTGCVTSNYLPNLLMDVVLKPHTKI